MKGTVEAISMKENPERHGSKNAKKNAEEYWRGIYNSYEEELIV
jgi:hypothetical protein